MMNMMYTTGPGIGLLVGIHGLAAFAFFIGVLFLLAFALKTLTHAQLKTWGLRLAIGGAVVCLLTIGAGVHSRFNTRIGGPQGPGNFMFMRFPGNDVGAPTGMMGGTKGMMRLDKDNVGYGMDMSMKGMTMMLQGRTGDDFDAAFLDMMIPHHQGAIEMAKLAEKNAKHDELKKLAADIIAAQQKEIDQMHSWQGLWGYDE